MPEPLIHYVIPLFLLTIYGLSLRKAVLISSLAILPDLDVLFHIHRSFSHSIFFILLFFIPIIIISKKYKQYYIESLIALMVTLSHLFMDVFTYYTPLFWPIYNNSLYIIAELTTNMNDVLDLKLTLQLTLKPVVFYHTMNMDAPIFSSSGVALTLVLLTGMVLIKYSYRWKHHFHRPD